MKNTRASVTKRSAERNYKSLGFFIAPPVRSLLAENAAGGRFIFTLHDLKVFIDFNKVEVPQ